MTKNNETVLIEARYWNEYNPNLLTRIYWRASLVPAAAVIPAPIAYIKVVAVKKLVVGSAVVDSGSLRGILAVSTYLVRFPLVLFTECLGCLARLL